MKKEGKVTYKTYDEIISVCDICGAESKPQENWSKDDDKDISVTIEKTVYFNGDIDEVAIDLCPKCFDEMAKWVEDTKQKRIETEAK